MDVLALLSTIWRHRLATLTVVVLTAGVANLALLASPPSWSGTSSYLLIEPPAPPDAAQIEADPALANVKSDNPFSRYGDTSVIIDVVSRRVQSADVQGEVAADGGASDYEVAPSNRYGSTSPIIDITVTAAKQDQVFRTLDQLDTIVSDQLAGVQTDEGVDPNYTFTLRQVDRPDQLTRELSSTLRLIVGVVGLGLVFLLLTLGTLEGRDRRRAARARARADGELTAGPPQRTSITTAETGPAVASNPTAVSDDSAKDESFGEGTTAQPEEPTPAAGNPTPQPATTDEPERTDGSEGQVEQSEDRSGSGTHEPQEDVAPPADPDDAPQDDDGWEVAALTSSPGFKITVLAPVSHPGRTLRLRRRSRSGRSSSGAERDAPPEPLVKSGVP